MKRIKLTDNQCRLFQNDMLEFGYDVSFAEIRRIANQVADGTYSETDVVARIMAKQIDEVVELRRKR